MTTRFNLLNLEKGLIVVLMTIRIADLQKCGSTCSFAEENNFFLLPLRLQTKNYFVRIPGRIKDGAMLAYALA